MDRHFVYFWYTYCTHGIASIFTTQNLFVALSPKKYKIGVFTLRFWSQRRALISWKYQIGVCTPGFGLKLRYCDCKHCVYHIFLFLTPNQSRNMIFIHTIVAKDYFVLPIYDTSVKMTLWPPFLAQNASKWRKMTRKCC